MLKDNNLVVICATVIAVSAMWLLGIEAKEMLLAIGSGLVGYLGSTKTGG